MAITITAIVPAMETHCADVRAPRVGDTTTDKSGNQRNIAQPMPTSYGHTLWMCEHGVIMNIACEVVCQFVRRCITIGWVFAQTFQADGLKLPIDILIDLTWSDRFLVNNGENCLHRRRRQERRPSCEQFVQYRTSEYMSDAGPTSPSPPPACSGDMYDGVPTKAPEAVNL